VPKRDHPFHPITAAGSRPTLGFDQGATRACLRVHTETRRPFHPIKAGSARHRRASAEKSQLGSELTFCFAALSRVVPLPAVTLSSR
jgi:hypothetical protein